MRHVPPRALATFALSTDHPRTLQRQWLSQGLSSTGFDNCSPEELAAGTDNATEQAEQILADSDDREAYHEPALDLRIDHRRAAETVDPAQGRAQPGMATAGGVGGSGE